jgi:hypothetical protein
MKVTELHLVGREAVPFLHGHLLVMCWSAGFCMREVEIAFSALSGDRHRTIGLSTPERWPRQRSSRRNILLRLGAQRTVDAVGSDDHGSAGVERF